MSQERHIAGRFVIRDLQQDLLGQGGMGVVYRAWDPQLERQVALKLLNRSAYDTRGRASLLREARAAAGLSHPNIVSIHDVGETEGSAFIVMELVHGQPMDEQPPRTLGEILSVFQQLCRALEHAHAQGIIHCDLKPQNVLLQADGSAKLVDFGLARSASARISSEGEIAGTIQYLAPEQAMGRPPDHLSDLYSLGVMLYEMVAGQLPFTANDPLALILQHVQDEPLPPSQYNPHIPAALEELILALLRKAPGERPGSASLVRERLDSIALALDTGGVQETARAGVPAATPEPVRSNLPLETSAFVGREPELRDLEGLLSQAELRLVTILAPGGMGKSRLALETARRSLDRFAHGVFFVPLAPLQTPAEIIPAVIHSLSFPLREGVPQQTQLFDYLHSKRLLLVLDNFEHLVEGAGVVNDILSNAPGVKILTTSRTRLNLQSEQLYHLQGMEFPDWETPRDVLEYNAVKLFVQGARRSVPGFEVRDEEIKYVARICRLVGGMPLGVLLAAAWVEALSLEELAHEIEQSIDILESELRDIPARQRSLRAVFDYSWNLLNQAEQTAFARLSVFQGGFTHQAGRTVADITPRCLMSLVGKSLVGRSSQERYQIHELLRQYAAEKLALSPAMQAETQDRHSSFYCSEVQACTADLKGARQRQAISSLNPEIKNVVAAWNWAVAQRITARLGETVEGLFLFYWRQYRHEEGELLAQAAVNALANPDSAEGQRILARMLSVQGLFNMLVGQYTAALACFSRSQDLLAQITGDAQVDDWDTAVLKFSQGTLTHYMGDPITAREYLSSSREIFHRLGETWWEACVTLSQFSSAMFHSQDYAMAHQCAEQGQQLFAAVGDAWGQAYLLKYLGIMVTYHCGQLSDGQRLFAKSSALFQSLGDPVNLAEAFTCQDAIANMYGRFAEVLELRKKRIAILEDLGDTLTFIGFGEISETCHHLGDYQQAEAWGWRGITPYISNQIRGLNLWYLGLALLALGKVDQAADLFQQSISAHQKVSNGVGIGVATASLSRARLAQGDLRLAWELELAALQSLLQDENFFYLLYALANLCLLLVEEDAVAQAVEIYTRIAQQPFVAKSVWFADVFGKTVEAAAARLPAEEAARARERGLAGDIWETAKNQFAAHKSRMT